MINYEPTEFVKLTSSTVNFLKVFLRHYDLHGHEIQMVVFAIKEYFAPVDRIISVEEISLEEYRRMLIESNNPSLN